MAGGMQRQFVNLVVDSCRSGSYVLRRINCVRLFHPKTQIGGGSLRAQQQQQETMVEVAELPEPAMSFDCYRFKDDCSGSVMRMPLGCNADKILSVDQDGSIVAYDARLNKVQGMPKLQGHNHMKNCLPIGVGGDSLYLIRKYPGRSSEVFDGCGFQALINGVPPRGVFARDMWYWHPLPPPPYLKDPRYLPYSESEINCCTVVGGSIWISTEGVGTYSFNTTRRQWRKAGSWDLPFCGSAEYVLELDRWFGFSGGEREKLFLCASDLMTTAANRRNAGPMLCGVWEEEVEIREDWQHVASHLVHVDSGRFCIARFFHVKDDGDGDGAPGIKENFIIFTGVEVTRVGRELQMAVHKSIRYNFDEKLFQWVF